MLLPSKMLFEEPEAFSDPLGSYAFDSHRKDIPQNRKEPDTEFEADVRYAVDRYVLANSKGALEREAPRLLQLVQQGKYKPLLDPGHPTVYRGLNFGDGFKVGPVFPGVELIAGEVGSLRNGIYQPPAKHQISGWSSDPEFMATMVEINSFAAPTCFVIQAYVLDNPQSFFGNPERFATDVTGRNDYHEEFETISLGNIRYEECRWFANPIDEELDEEYLAQAQAFVRFETNRRPVKRLAQ